MARADVAAPAADGGPRTSWPSEEPVLPYFLRRLPEDAAAAHAP